jgi:hypothetical protein
MHARIVCLCFISAAAFAACADGHASRNDAATPVPTATAARSPTMTPTATARDSATATATGTPDREATSTRTATPSPSSTPTVTPTPESCDDPQVHAREPLCALDDRTFTCEILTDGSCLLPYPSSVFLRPDPATPTGFRLAYPRQAMPANADGVHIDPTEWNTLDGFSPGPIIRALFPQGVDLDASAAPSITNPARSLEADSPTVIIEAESGARILHFTELDPQAVDPATQTLTIVPGIRLRDATRYIVAIRGLVDGARNPLPATRTFRVFRDGIVTPVREIEGRRARFEDIFARLAQAGVVRDDLILAWDFVTASTEALTGRALSLRDQGLQANGPGAPPFEVTSVEDDVNESILRRVEGTFTVPLFLTSASPPAFYVLDERGVPRQNGTASARFIVTIPRRAVEGGRAHPARAIVYGHGLLESREEVNVEHLQRFQNRFNFVLAATDWIGLSGDDLQSFLDFIPDLSGFPTVPDRLQQATLNFILLGRLLTAPDGLRAHPAFQVDGVPVIDAAELYYYGISQGGIAGATYMALSQDTTRAVLGVGAANYSVLLPRSFTAGALFLAALRQLYPDPIEASLLPALLQQVWDRADPQAYLPHLIDEPLPGTPAKRLLLQAGLHDSQVPNIGTEIEVRSLGIPAVAPSVQSWLQVPERDAPFDGSAVALYDVNATPEPLAAMPPATDNGVHEAVRRLDAAQLQIDAFLRPDGAIETFCAGPCFFRDVPDVEQR